MSGLWVFVGPFLLVGFILVLFAWTGWGEWRNRVAQYGRHHGVYASPMDTPPSIMRDVKVIEVDDPSLVRADWVCVKAGVGVEPSEYDLIVYIHKGAPEPEPEYITWSGAVYFPEDPFDPVASATLTLTPPMGLTSIPCLVYAPEESNASA